MKFSEHIKWAVSNCEETEPSLIKSHLLNDHGAEVSLSEIKMIQSSLNADSMSRVSGGHGIIGPVVVPTVQTAKDLGTLPSKP